MRSDFFIRFRQGAAFYALVLATLIATEVAGADVIAIANKAELPLLTTSAAVAQLKRSEAAQGFPVKLRGVVICVVPEHQAFVLQDATRGVFIVDTNAPTQVGELWEVEGITDKGSFAPIVMARQKTFLGPGNLPSPVQPAWDQLMNGSLDDQLVEISGVVESSSYDPGGWSHVILRTQGGSLRLDLPGSDITAETLARCDKNLVHIRGCYFAMTDTTTWQVKVGQVRIYAATISMEQPDLNDLFSAPAKTAVELMQFDPRASAFRRVKVTGQIIHVRGAEHFMIDGTNGVRFVISPGSDLVPGDLVEVVGFPKLTGAAPVLTEAVARKNGHASLPREKNLEAGNLMSTEQDSTLVRVKGAVASLRRTDTNLVIEMQADSWRFLARLNVVQDFQTPPLRIGSLLELTGVYASQNNNLTPGEAVVPFELLLNSPADIHVLKTASWWTLQRLLVVVSLLAVVLVLAALWITQLRHKVEQRTAELSAQIKERQRAEHQHAMEQERARIAQDLHDELGSGLTEIGMLATRTKSATSTVEARADNLVKMSDKAHEMVAALDEIVWAMNPSHNSLASLVSYFSLHADRFLGLANISWKLEDGAVPSDRALDSHDRHQLFRAYKEALNNVVRHSGARNVRVSIRVMQNELFVTIADNGHGMATAAEANGSNGVAGMRTRVEKLGGRFELTSEPGRGTTVRFCVPTN